MDAPSPRPALRTDPPRDRASDPVRVSRRRFRTLNLTTMLPVVAVVGILLVALEARTWVQGAVLGLGLLAALVAFERWAAGDLPRVALPCLLVTAAVWPYGVLVVDGDVNAAYYGIAVVGGMVVPQLPRLRPLAFAALVAYVAGVGALGLLAAPPVTMGAVISHVIVPTGLTVVLTGLMFPNKGFYDVVAELEEAREREAELAVIRERMRFASDLHDIQGHTLHVVKLKIALAQKLVHRDGGAGADLDRVEQELREMYALVGDTIAQSKEVAYGQRRLNLAAELENAVNLFRAAGIQVRVERRSDVGPRHVELLGQVLRETTTNILRHAQAALVRIELDERSITVVNDGATEEELPALRGLATLRRRVAEDGGELHVELADGRFRTAAAFPAPGTGPGTGPATLTAGQEDR
ncbi:sensor histidine kinase [Ornithinimicrobium sp. LYQ92]|uniref:sensor histidine kinase n=1 Tax=Serinicoccus sp. LYQ92 TaxID=3378798 RepID=UPI003854C2E4